MECVVCSEDLTRSYVAPSPCLEAFTLQAVIFVDVTLPPP